MFFGQPRLKTTPAFVKAKKLSVMYDAFSNDYELYNKVLHQLPDVHYGDTMFRILSTLDNVAFEAIKKAIADKENWANILSGPKIPNKLYQKDNSLSLIEQIGKQLFDEYLLFPKELYFLGSSNTYIQDFYNQRTKKLKSNIINNNDYSFNDRRKAVIKNKHSLLDNIAKSTNNIVGKEANAFLKQYFKPIKQEVIKQELFHKNLSNSYLHPGNKSIDLEDNFLDNDIYKEVFNNLKDNPFKPENSQNLLIVLDEFLTLTFMDYEVNESDMKIQRFDEWKTDFQNFPFATANQIRLQKGVDKLKEQSSNQNYEEVLNFYTTTYIDPLNKKIDIEKKELQRHEEEVADFEKLSKDEQEKKAQEFYTELLTIADLSNKVKKQNPNSKTSNTGLELLNLLFDEE